MKVSVICTVFNEAGSIEDFVFKWIKDEVVNEIVIVDGGSTDDTDTILSRLQQTHPKLTVSIGEKLNVAAGRNKALSIASGDIFLFADAGCVYPNDWAEKLVSAVKQHSCPVASVYHPEPGTNFQNMIGEILVGSVDKKFIERYLPSCRSFCISRGDLGECFFNEGLTLSGEDTEFMDRVLSGNDWLVIDDVSVGWQMRTSIRSVKQQMYNYGLGDGESGSRDSLAIIFAIRATPLVHFWKFGISQKALVSWRLGITYFRAFSIGLFRRIFNAV